MSRPALTGVSPSTSLRGIDQRDELVLVEVVGQRQLEQDAVDARVGVELRASRSASSSGSTSPGTSWWKDSMPTSAQSSRFMRT